MDSFRWQAPPSLVPRMMFLLFISATLVSCTEDNRSELVKRLESIFYDSGFASIPDRTFRASDFGAVGDGQTRNTRFIQAAIDAAHEAGGGVVVFDTGIYLSGALFVKSNVELHLDKGVTIKAIHDEKAFPDVWTRVAGIEMNWPAALVNVYEQENVRITGKGTIDGNGKFWWDKFWGDPPRSGGMWTDYNARGIRWAVDYDCKRVRAVVVYNSRDVLLEDFRVERSGFWTVTLTYCERVHVNGIVVRNNIGGYGPSSDGINTDSSSDILVENCDIDCNDDNLCIKSGRDADGLRVNRPAENIVYRNSITRAGHGLFTLGSETSGGMHHIEVYGLKAEGTNTGIRFKSARVRGGVIEDIWFHDIEMDRVASPIHFELDWYPAYSYPVIPDSLRTDTMPRHWKIMTTPVEPPEKGIPQFRNLRITRVRALHATMAVYVNAYPEKPIRNVRMEHVFIQAAKAGRIVHARDWTMDHVTLEVPEGDSIRMEDCRQVPSPVYQTLPDGESGEAIRGSGGKTFNFLALLDSVQSGPDREGKLLICDSKGIIAHGDTLETDTLKVVVIPGSRQKLVFFEPLGDGFYVTPVEVSSGEEDGLLKVTSEKTHHWEIYVKGDGEPDELSGLDEWKYHPESRLIEAVVTGSAFRATLR